MIISLPHAYSQEQLMQEAKFVDGLHLASSELLETFRLMPRRVRYVADSQRWLMSQAALALHFEHKSDSSKPAVTSQNLARLFEQSRVVSKNTITAFLMEMQRYRFAEPVELSDRRHRAVRATEDSEKLAQHYLEIHLRALDAIDQGPRFDASRHKADFTSAAQPRFARRLLAQPDWIRPPPSVANFVKTDSGSNILHALLSRIPKHARVDGQPIWVGPVSPSEIAKHALISPTHAVRLFARAREAGLLGWAHKSNRGDCWISSELAHDYRYWQALKLSAMSHAVRDAHQYLQTAILAPGAPDHQRHKSVGA